MNISISMIRPDCPCVKTRTPPGKNIISAVVCCHCFFFFFLVRVRTDHHYLILVRVQQYTAGNKPSKTQQATSHRSYPRRGISMKTGLRLYVAARRGQPGLLRSVRHLTGGAKKRPGLYQEGETLAQSESYVELNEVGEFNEARLNVAVHL